MNLFQWFLIVFALGNLFLFVKARKECQNSNSYGLTKALFLLGMYVWGDVLIFSLFWTSVALICLIVNNVYLFFTFVSLFWVVRSFGETMYWFHQQFSTVRREPPEKVELYSLVHNDSVWFIQQVKNQCITILSLVMSIYFSVFWIKTGF